MARKSADRTRKPPSFLVVCGSVVGSLVGCVSQWRRIDSKASMVLESRFARAPFELDISVGERLLVQEMLNIERSQGRRRRDRRLRKSRLLEIDTTGRTGTRTATGRRAYWGVSVPLFLEETVDPFGRVPQRTVEQVPVPLFLGETVKPF